MAVFIYYQDLDLTGSFLSQNYCCSLRPSWLAGCRRFPSRLGWHTGARARAHAHTHTHTHTIKITFLMCTKCLGYFHNYNEVCTVPNVYAFSIQFQRSKDSTVFVAIRLRVGRFEARIPLRAKILYFLQNAQAGSGVQWASCSVRTGYFHRG